MRMTSAACSSDGEETAPGPRRRCMGGHAAESVVLGHCSSGAENDLKHASELAFKMAAHFRMSEGVGPVDCQHESEHVFLG